MSEKRKKRLKEEYLRTLLEIEGGENPHKFIYYMTLLGLSAAFIVMLYFIFGIGLVILG